MSENTKIEWADHTFNPWIGCTKISPACDNCYAERIDHRFGGGHWGAGSPRKRTKPANWAQPRRWNRQAAERGVRYRVFCASLADVFDNEIADEWRADLFGLIRETPNLDWLLLTKRIGNAANMLPVPFDFEAQYPNVWLGATVVNQAEADRDVPKLLATPARIRFLSIEPMLGPIDLTRVPAKCSNDRNDCCGWPLTMNVLEGSDNCPGCEGPEKWFGGLDWIIAGGESGPQARPSHPYWFRSLRDQCVDADVPFLFKQWGEYAPRSGYLSGGGSDFTAIDPLCERWPDVARIASCGCDGRFLNCNCNKCGDEIYMQRVGKQTAGRELYGRTWDQAPTPEHNQVNS